MIVQQNQGGNKTPSKNASNTASSSSANQTGIPLGLTYAPVQVMSSAKQEPDHWAKLEEVGVNKIFTQFLFYNFTFLRLPNRSGRKYSISEMRSRQVVRSPK